MRHLKFRYIFALYAAVLLFICMFMIYPTHDDWGYAAPKPNMNILASLMPTARFWRPFDRLIEYGLGYAPYLFPLANYVVLIAGHLGLCLVLFFTLRKLTNNHLYSCISTLFFCVSPGIVLTITNSDFINQVGAFIFGVAATLSFFKGKYIIWLICAFISVLIKENGIVWFIAPIMMHIVYLYVNGKDFVPELRHHFVFILAGIVGMIVYFSVRFYLLGSIVLGSEAGDKGRYLLNFSILNIIRNYCLVIGGAVTSLDSLAIFLKPRNIPIIIVTAVASAIFLCFMIIYIRDIFRKNKRLFWGLFGLFVCAGYISSPYCVMGHNSEATTYEMAFMSALIIGITLSYCNVRRYHGFVLAFMLACMLLSSGHKIYVTHEYSLGIHDFLIEHSTDFPNVPKKAYVYFIKDIPEYGYATYTYTMGHGLSYGIAFNSLWNWKAQITMENVSSDIDINFSPESLPEYDTVFSLSESGKLSVLRN